MSAAPTIRLAAAGPITGATSWRMVRSMPVLSGGIVRIHETWRGAYIEAVTAYNYLVSNAPFAESVTPSVSDNSAIATFTKIYVYSQPWFSLKQHEAQTPQYECLGVRMQVELRTFEPFAADIAGDNAWKYEDVDSLIADGQGEVAKAAYITDPVKSYVGLRLRGVTHFERVTYQLRITRTFDTRENIPDLSGDYGNVSKVTNWAGLHFMGDTIPSFVVEPQMRVASDDTIGSFSIVSLEWKGCEPRIEYRGKGVSVILGADGDYKWSSVLYGGTLSP